MSVVIASIVTITVVVAIIAAVAFAVFEVTPWADHRERFRDARGARIGSSPRLD